MVVYHILVEFLAFYDITIDYDITMEHLWQHNGTLCHCNIG